MAEQKPSHEFMTASDGVKIHYMTLGEGTPVVLIHGYTGSAEGNWFSNGIARALAKNHRVIAIDCRGHGQSDKPHDSKMYGPRLWQDVIELMNHLKLDKVHVHGYSMGGAIVTQLLIHHGDRFVTAGYGGSGVRETDPQRLAEVPPDSEKKDPSEGKASAALRSSPTRDGAALEAVGRSWREGLSKPIDLSKIKIPVLAVNGEYDRPNAKTHRMKRELSDFQSVILPGKSHLTAVMAQTIPQLYIDTIVEFISDHDPR